MGRMWQTLLLMQWNPIFAWMPVETIVKEHQQEYYAALNSSDTNADSTNFIVFMLKVIQRTLKEIKVNEKKITVKITQKITVNQEKILAAVKENPFVTQEELSEIVGIAKLNIIKNMKKLQENGLLRRVGADKNGHWEIISEGSQ